MHGRCAWWRASIYFSYASYASATRDAKNLEIRPEFLILSPCTKFRMAEYHNGVMAVHSYNHLAVMAGALGICTGLSITVDSDSMDTNALPSSLEDNERQTSGHLLSPCSGTWLLYLTAWAEVPHGKEWAGGWIANDCRVIFCLRDASAKNLHLCLETVSTLSV